MLAQQIMNGGGGPVLRKPDDDDDDDDDDGDDNDYDYEYMMIKYFS